MYASRSLEERRKKVTHSVGHIYDGELGVRNENIWCFVLVV